MCRDYLKKKGAVSLRLSGIPAAFEGLNLGTAMPVCRIPFLPELMPFPDVLYGGKTERRLLRVRVFLDDCLKTAE